MNDLESLLFDIEKIEALIREEDLIEIKRFKEYVIDAVLAYKLYENDLIKKLVLKFKKEIEAINGALLNQYSDILPDKKRDMLIAYKNACKLFIDIFDFDNLNKNIETIKRSVKEIKNNA